MNDGPKYFPKYLGGTYYPHFMAGMAGFGPANAGVKVRCLTAWLHPNIFNRLSREARRWTHLIFTKAATAPDV